ncbi:tyrosine-type recombinase/integrase [Streptomyces lydicus]|uniref:tyrosine-type recombinase/integrase n=1 Tax=Streptomyces lydicus TaxID=47763 RepID=UPI00379D97C3
MANVAKSKVRRTTYVNYESLVRNYITADFGKKKLARLTARDIRAFLTKTAATCQCRVQDTVRSTSSAAVPSGSAARSSHPTGPCASCWCSCAPPSSTRCVRNVELGMGTKREIEPLTAEEGRRLLTAARSNRLWAPYELAVRIGLRRGEVLGLRWSDVDLHEGVVTVRQALQRGGSVGSC